MQEKVKMSSSQTIVAPSRIGSFVFKGTVGSGAFSVVKLSYNTELKQFFACKIVPRNRISSEDLEERFEIEIRINQQMHHPGVVQIVDLLKDDMNYYIFMEFCPNGELFKYIVDRTRLPEPEAAHFMFQFLDALNYVHSLGVAHRDLKPENLLLDPVGRLKISDFGLSKFVGDSGMVSTPCGSPCYASPECLSGHDYDGRISDIWSMGVIMFAMVTGQLPWTKRNQTQLFNQIRKGDYTIPSFLSAECKDLLSRLLTVDVSTRITLEEALNHPWIKNNADFDASNFPSTFTMVSLKKVDAFFESSSFKDANIEDENVINNRSQRKLTFRSAVRAISVKNIFPSAGKAKPSQYSQSLQNDGKSIINYSANQTLPSSSLGNISQNHNQKIMYHSVPKSVTNFKGAPKVFIPKKPVSTWK